MPGHYNRNDLRKSMRLFICSIKGICAKCCFFGFIFTKCVAFYVYKRLHYIVYFCILRVYFNALSYIQLPLLDQIKQKNMSSCK